MSATTTLAYLRATYVFTQRARVVGSALQGATDVVLDSTLFHPQGGGQPSDTGHIRSVATNALFRVTSVRKDGHDGPVKHMGAFDDSGAQGFAEGEEVHCQSRVSTTSGSVFICHLACSKPNPPRPRWS